jgi:single-strand DNA-binding protein
MSSFNKVILMGNLTRDPEIRFTQNQMAICKVGLAVNRRFKDSQTDEWREEPTFVDVTIFGKRGEAFEKYHRKGASAFLEGELRLDTWEDKNSGAKRSKLYVVANNWEFVGGSRDGGGGGQPQREPAAASSGGYGDYASGGGNSGGGNSGGGNSGGGNAGGGEGSGPGILEADDTPF